jgi:IS6 family transposase
MPRSSRPDLFTLRHFEPAIVVCAVRWYLRYSLSYRDVREIFAERGLSVAHTTLWLWIQRYAPELNSRSRTRLEPAIVPGESMKPTFA